MKLPASIHKTLRRLGLSAEAELCGFCGGTEPPLVSARDVRICARCIASAREVAGLGAPPEHLSLVDAQASPCTFCMTEGAPGSKCVRGASASICSACITLCEDILRETTAPT